MARTSAIGGPPGQALVDSHKVEPAQTGDLSESAKGEVIGQMFPYMGTNPTNQAIILQVVRGTDITVGQRQFQERLPARPHHRRIDHIPVIHQPTRDVLKPPANVGHSQRPDIGRPVHLKREVARRHRMNAVRPLLVHAPWRVHQDISGFTDEYLPGHAHCHPPRHRNNYLPESV